VIEPLVLAFALTLARVGTFVHLMPLLGGPNVPRTVKIGLSMALAMLFFDEGFLALADSRLIVGSLTWLSLLLALAREALLGGILGFAMTLFLVPARLAGEFIAQESGLTYANVVTASGDGSASPFATLLELLASLVFFALDLHHVFLLVLQETLRHSPIGHPFALPSWDLIHAASAAQEMGLLIAAPVALCLFLTTMVLALMTRAAPQMNLYSIGFPLRVLVCLGAILVLLPQILSGIIGGFSYFAALLQLRG
jgi:flagellar biosynthetic protein FliR